MRPDPEVAEMRRLVRGRLGQKVVGLDPETLVVRQSQPLPFAFVAEILPVPCRATFDVEIVRNSAGIPQLRWGEAPFVVHHQVFIQTYIGPHPFSLRKCTWKRLPFESLPARIKSVMTQEHGGEEVQCP